MARWLGFLSALVLTLGPLPAWAQAPPELGVVTTLQGQATVSRPANPAALPLKFKDSIFERDKINTAEKSIVRVLMGGKAIVTVRELSVLTITEDLGKTTINLDSGKIAVAVARQRMQPGERLEVHTPNAVAAVRGTVFIVEVKRQGAQQGGGNLGATTQVTSVSGSVDTWALGNPGNVALLNAFQSIGITARNVGNIGNLTQQQMNALLADFASDPQLGLDNSTWAALSLEEQNKLVALTFFLLPQLPPRLPPSQATGKSGNNGGFETGLFAPGWNLGGTGKVITSFGGFTAPEGQFMGFISSGPGSGFISNRPGSLEGAPSTPPVSNITQYSSLTQSFLVTAGTLYTIKATYNFVSNEYPFWVNLSHPNRPCPCNDFFDIRVTAPAGQTTLLKLLDVNTAFTPVQVSHQVVNVAGFSAGGSCLTCGWGYTDFQTVSFSWLAPASGGASLLFEVGDVGDTRYASGALIDNVSVIEDPPLYLLQGGAKLVRASTDPLLDYTGGSAGFDSAMVIGAGSKVSLAGQLLRATNTDLTVPTSLLTVLPGGSFVSSTTDPLVSLKGGTHALGTDVAMFDLAGGGSTALDAETGLTLASDKPLSTGGVLFQADGATVNTRQAVRVDAALLEATAPLIALFNSAAMTTVSDAIDLTNRSKVTGAGSLVALDASRMAVSSGALVNVAGGSVLRMGGDLVSLRNGSVLTIFNGPLLFVSGGSIVNISGALVAFSGSGGSILSVSNSLCGGACVLFAGIPVAFSGGATAANVAIGAGAIKNQGLGSIKLASSSTALISVSGATSKVTIGGK